MGHDRLPLDGDQPNDGPWRMRQCVRCRTWLMTAWVTGILVGVERKPISTSDAARARILSKRRWIYSESGGYLSLVPDKRLIEMLQTGEQLTLHIEHDHQPLVVVTPEPSQGPPPAPNTVIQFDWDEVPF